MRRISTLAAVAALSAGALVALAPAAEAASGFEIVDVSVKDVVLLHASLVHFNVDVTFALPLSGVIDLDYSDVEIWNVDGGYALDDDLQFVDSVDGFETYRASFWASKNADPGKWYVDASAWVDYEVCDVDDFCFDDFDTVDEDAVASFDVRRNTKLTFNAGPEPVAKGKSITVSGVLTRMDPDKGYVGYAAKPIKIYFDPIGSKAKAYIGTATTNSKGSYSRSFTAKEDGNWYVVFEGTWAHASEAAVGDFVDVR